MKDSNFVGRPLKKVALNYAHADLLRILRRARAAAQREAKRIREQGENQSVRVWQNRQLAH